MLVADIVDEQLPQTRLHARTDLGNKPLQYADTGQQYLAGDQPADGVIEQQAGAVWSGPAQRAEPAPEAKPNTGVYKLAVAIAGTDFGRVPPTLFTLTISGDACEVDDIGLGRQGVQDSGRYVDRVFEEGPQEPHRRELQCKAQTTAVAPLIGDPFPIVIVEMEVPRQLIGR